MKENISHYSRNLDVAFGASVGIAFFTLFLGLYFPALQIFDGNTTVATIVLSIITFLTYSYFREEVEIGLLRRFFLRSLWSVLVSLICNLVFIFIVKFNYASHGIYPSVMVLNTGIIIANGLAGWIIATFEKDIQYFYLVEE